MAPARHADSEAHRRPAARSSDRDTSPDVYTNTEADNYPGGEWAKRSALEECRGRVAADRVAKERTRPGSDPSEKVYERVVDACVGPTTSGNPILRCSCSISLAEGSDVESEGPRPTWDRAERE